MTHSGHVEAGCIGHIDAPLLFFSSWKLVND